MKLADATVPAHESVTFECEVSKDDSPVEWLLNKEKIEPGEKYEIHQDGRKHSLTVHDLKPEDSGEYTARVGSNDTSASLAVSGRICFKNSYQS